MLKGTYLDYNATAPLLPVVAAGLKDICDAWGNPSSTHSSGKLARKVIEDARTHVATSLSTSPQQITFTGTGTEANAMVARGSGLPHFVTTLVEHSSVLENMKEASNQTCATLSVDAQGILDLDQLERHLATLDGPALVAVQLANNETGVIQPIKDIADIVHAHKGWLHTDAIQAYGKIPFTFEDLGADSLALSAHKVGGPTGIGALVLRENLHVNPLIYGGGQERGLRSGTSNIFGAHGFGLAAKEIYTINIIYAALQDFRDSFETVLKEEFPSLKIAGDASPRLPNTTLFTCPGLRSDVQFMHLDLKGFSVSVGSACSSGKVKPSRVLLAMGYTEAESGCSLRISMGPSTTKDDINRFCKVWLDLAKSNRHKAAA